MSKQYSIADARRSLPTLVDEAEAGAEVQLTRRGKTVAVVVSLEAYERLKSQRTSFADAYGAFRETFPEGDGPEGRGKDETGPSYFRNLRDRTGGRKVDL
jgi:prevent-host-death family protein